MQIEELYKRYIETWKVSTDTRQITPGSVFFALKGPRYNANEFAAEALTQGASCAVVDEEGYARGKKYVLVKDALQALQQLAKYHRSQLTIPFLALTGSNGKTTTKELVQDVLSRKFTTSATSGNLNNHIGVPLTVLAVRREAEIAVIEMGANHLGEIALLCDIANPTHGIITNIGKAHLGTFGGFENIVRAKSELFQYLLTTSGTAFINSQNPLLANMARRFKDPVFYPAKGDYYHCELRGSDPFLSVLTESGKQLQTQLVGSYNFENVAAALCIGKYFGVDELESNRAISSYSPANMRSQVIRKGSNTIILDAYNANPSSMTAAIENLAAMKAEKKVLILGDMFELEGEAEKEHRFIGKLIREKGFQTVYLCGSLFKAALTEIPFAKHFEEKQQLLDDLKTTPVQSSTILVKASRGVGLEATMELL